MDPVALAIQKLLPVANLPGDVNNYSIPSYTQLHAHHELFVQVGPEPQLDDQDLRLLFPQQKLLSVRQRPPGGVLGNADTNNSNHTTRLNYDQTITPTLLFHVGIGYFQTTAAARSHRRSIRARSA